MAKYPCFVYGPKSTTNSLSLSLVRMVLAVTLLLEKYSQQEHRTCSAANYCSSLFAITQNHFSPHCRWCAVDIRWFSIDIYIIYPHFDETNGIKDRTETMHCILTKNHEKIPNMMHSTHTQKPSLCGDFRTLPKRHQQSCSVKLITIVNTVRSLFLFDVYIIKQPQSIYWRRLNRQSEIDSRSYLDAFVWFINEQEIGKVQKLVKFIFYFRAG